MANILSSLSDAFGVLVLVEVSLPLLVFSHTSRAEETAVRFLFLKNTVAQACLLYNWVYFQLLVMMAVFFGQYYDQLHDAHKL